MLGARGGDRGSGPPENHKNIGFLSNTGPNHLKNHKATKLLKPAFNVGPAKCQNAIKMVFHWLGHDCSLKVVLGSSLPSSSKKKIVKVGSH